MITTEKRNEIKRLIKIHKNIYEKSQNIDFVDAVKELKEEVTKLTEKIKLMK